MGAGHVRLPLFVANYGITGCFNNLRIRYSKSGGNTQTRDAAAIFGCCVPHFLFCHFVTVSKTVFSCGKENIRAAWFLCQKALLQAAFYAPKQ